MSTHPEQICSYVPIEILCTCIGFALTAHCQAISYLVKIKIYLQGRTLHIMFGVCVCVCVCVLGGGGGGGGGQSISFFSPIHVTLSAVGDLMHVAINN